MSRARPARRWRRWSVIDLELGRLRGQPIDIRDAAPGAAWDPLTDAVLAVVPEVETFDMTPEQGAVAGATPSTTAGWRPPWLASREGASPDWATSQSEDPLGNLAHSVAVLRRFLEAHEIHLRGEADDVRQVP